MAAAKQFADRYWCYSLTAYAAPEVQALCLRLQNDYGANINLLLFGGFIGHSGQVLEAQDLRRIAERVARFNRRYTQRIRKLRQRVQQLAAGECYQQLKALELKAEQLEQLITTAACDTGMLAAQLREQNAAAANQVLHNLLVYQAGWPLKCAESESLVSELATALQRGSANKRNQSQQ